MVSNSDNTRAPLMKRGRCKSTYLRMRRMSTGKLVLHDVMGVLANRKCPFSSPYHLERFQGYHKGGLLNPSRVWEHLDWTVMRGRGNLSAR